MDDDLKMNYNETDEDKSQKEFESKVRKVVYGTSDKERIKKALKEIDELIEDYESVHKVYVISSHSGGSSGARATNKAAVTKKTIDNLEKIKKILEK